MQGLLEHSYGILDLKCCIQMGIVDLIEIDW